MQVNQPKRKTFAIDRDWKPTAVYNYDFGRTPGGFNKGVPVPLKAGEFYAMKILLGDDGGFTYFSLLVEIQGVGYARTNGLPILPVFRVPQVAPPPGEQPPFQPNGPMWQSREMAAVPGRSGRAEAPGQAPTVGRAPRLPTRWGFCL